MRSFARINEAGHTHIRNELIRKKSEVMTEITKLALRVLQILDLKRSWPLIRAVESAIQTDAKFLGCTLDEASEAMKKDAWETWHSHTPVYFAQWQERRMERMRRLTTKEQRKSIHGDKFVAECLACACGLLHLVRGHNRKLFVGCDCFYAPSDCACRFRYDVPECLPIPESDLAGMNEFERAKAIIARAPRCLNCNAPMSGRMGSHGLFAFCTVKDCTYTNSLEDAEVLEWIPTA